uniref:Putative secreted protein n=1 Tax=Anopheles darlingi TaxID=43151 RepID=A0A2M4DPG5_ANODA
MHQILALFALFPETSGAEMLVEVNEPFTSKKKKRTQNPERKKGKPKRAASSYPVSFLAHRFWPTIAPQPRGSADVAFLCEQRDNLIYLIAATRRYDWHEKGKQIKKNTLNRRHYCTSCVCEVW